MGNDGVRDEEVEGRRPVDLPMGRYRTVLFNYYFEQLRGEDDRMVKAAERVAEVVKSVKVGKVGEPLMSDAEKLAKAERAIESLSLVAAILMSTINWYIKGKEYPEEDDKISLDIYQRNGGTLFYSGIRVGQILDDAGLALIEHAGYPVEAFE